MKFGVKDDKILVQLAAGYPPFESETLDTMLKRQDMVCELMGAAVLLLRNDYSTHQELVEYFLDNLE